MIRLINLITQLNLPMNRIRIVIAAVFLLMLAACGGGSSNDPSPNVPQADQGLAIAPTPTPTPSTNVGPGALVDLFGQAVFAYGFSGTEPVFFVEVSFALDDVVEDNNGRAVLIAIGTTSSRLTEDASFIPGRNLTIGCTFVNEANQFLCVLDSNGRNESIFLFDRPINGVVFGAFEFCAQSSITDCTTEILQAPDGDVLLVLSSPLATLITSAKQTPESSSETFVPYLQYLEQGSASIDGIGIASTEDDRADAMVDALMRIRMLATEY